MFKSIYTTQTIYTKRTTSSRSSSSTGRQHKNIHTLERAISLSLSRGMRNLHFRLGFTARLRECVCVYVCSTIYVNLFVLRVRTRQSRAYKDDPEASPKIALDRHHKHEYICDDEGVGRMEFGPHSLSCQRATQPTRAHIGRNAGTNTLPPPPAAAAAVASFQPSFVYHHRFTAAPSAQYSRIKINRKFLAMPPRTSSTPY